jgi:hypothetical protein
MVDFSEYFIFCTTTIPCAFHLHYGRSGTIFKQGCVQFVELGGDH